MCNCFNIKVNLNLHSKDLFISMICHQDWIQNSIDIILIPRNHLDKLWFTFSEEVIAKFQYFFSKIYKTFNIQCKRWICSSLCQDIILSQKHVIYDTADLSQISWKSKTGNFVISYLLWVLVSFSKINYLVQMNQLLDVRRLFFFNQLPIFLKKDMYRQF